MRQPGSRTALLTLTAINLLNFADRYVPSAVKSLIQDDLHLSDFQTSLPSTGMVIVYTIFAIIFGMISDKHYFDRRIILCGAIICWSLATSLAGLATNLTQLVIVRSLVGIGEAAYGTIAPPMLSDFYPVNERNIMYGIYYLAVPVGGALGFIIGAGVGSTYGYIYI
jgi:MFS family permease